MTQPTPDARTWLRSLHELARAWVASGGQANAWAQTLSYVDLLFAFGFARLGASQDAIELMERSREVLSGLDDAHLFLFHAFRYRIREALEGRPHAGPLPHDQMDNLEALERLARYVVDRLRKHSRILEPDQRLNPYRHWGSRISNFEKALADLTDLMESQEVVQRVDCLLTDHPVDGKRGSKARSRILHAALDMAPRVGEDFARKLLDQTIPAYDALPEPREHAILMEQSAFLEKALFVAGYFQDSEHLLLLTERFRALLRRYCQPQQLQVLDRALAQCIQSLVECNQPEALDELLGEARDLLLQGRRLEDIDPRQEDHGLIRIRAVLRLCRGWFAFGFDTLAEPVLQAVWSWLLASGLPSRDRSELACAYLAALGHAPQVVARGRLEDVFRHLPGIRDTYTTSTHFSVSQMDVVEAAVLAAVQAHGHGID
jgi:hypothetical protein